jgi:hypothetical protein
LVTEGHGPSSGVFSLHVDRLVKFLTACDLSIFEEGKRTVISELMQKATSGEAAPGDWLNLARAYLEQQKSIPEAFWKEL